MRKRPPERLISMTEKIVKPQALALICLLLIGLGLRIWNFPPRYQLRDADELGYTYGGLLLWEGIVPGFKMAPAGLQTWIGWAYCACQSLANLMEKQKGEQASALLRPLYAVDKALFETYRDASILRQITVAIIILISLGGIWAAFQTGFRRAGMPGGLLAGGLMALLPIFIQASGMAKPYMLAWSFAVIAHYFAATQTKFRRWAGSAIFMGLSLSSRIEMLLFFPIILWEIWNEKEQEGFGRTALRLTSLMIIVMLLISPWLLTNLLGNIRVTATVRFSSLPVQKMLGSLLGDFAWFQGLGPVSILLAAGLAAGPADKRRNYWLLLFIFVVLFLTMLRPTPYGLRHHGATVVAAVLASSLALARLQRLHSGAALILAAALLVLPAINAVSTIMANRRSYMPDQATAWVEKHVPTGTRVYLCPTLHDPLPTQQSADSLWAQVTDAQAWKTKFRASLSRFNLPPESTPRSLSEENLIQERGNRRRWFILGGRPQTEAPRFDIKIISGGSPFDITPDEAIVEFERTGGVFIWRQARQPAFRQLRKEMGVPKVSWTDRNGQATLVYYEPAAEELRGTREQK